MIPLTNTQISERRVELHTVEDQLRTLGRRRSTLRAEILSGYAQPERVDARQLSLPVEDRAALDEAAAEAVDEARSQDVRKAILLALEGRSQATVEGLLQIVGTQFRMTGRRPVTAEEIEDEVMALSIQGALVPGSKPDWYRRPEAPQSRAKNEKAPAKEPAVLGPLTMTQVRQAILDEIGTWKRWHSGAAADQALWAELRRTGHDEDEDGSSFDVARAIDDVGMQALTALATEGKIQCSEKPGNWGNLYAPLHVPRTAEGGPDEPKHPRKPAVKKGKAQPKKTTKPARKAAKKAPLKRVAETPARTLGSVTEEVLREWKTWLIREQLQAKVLEAMPLGAQLSERDWKEMLSEMTEQGRLERTEENGHTLYRLPPDDAADRAKDRVRWDFILDTVEKKITKRPLHIVPEGDAEEAICRLLTDAGALLDDGNLETSCEIPEKHAGKACMQVTREYLYDLIDEKPGQTAAELASAVEVPEGLVAALLAQLARAKKLRVTGKPHDLRWHAIPAKEKRPKPHAQDRTLPILPDLQPAPAREEAAE